MADWLGSGLHLNCKQKPVLCRFESDPQLQFTFFWNEYAGCCAREAGDGGGVVVVFDVFRLGVVLCDLGSRRFGVLL